jgi:hypothetical protein
VAKIHIEIDGTIELKEGEFKTTLEKKIEDRLWEDDLLTELGIMDLTALVTITD